MKNKVLNRVKSRNQRQPHSPFRGRELKVMPQPPEFTSRPWFGLTVRIDDPATLLTVTQIVGAIRTQLGWPTTVDIALRIKSVKFWSPLVAFSAGPLTPLNVAFLDFIQEAAAASGQPAIVNRVLEQYTRYPDQVNRACIGYEYSLAHSSITLATTGVSNVDIARMTGLGVGSVCYVQCLFRSGTVSPAALAVDVSDDESVEILPRPRRSKYASSDRL